MLREIQRNPMSVSRFSLSFTTLLNLPRRSYLFGEASCSRDREPFISSMHVFCLIYNWPERVCQKSKDRINIITLTVINVEWPLVLIESSLEFQPIAI